MIDRTRRESAVGAIVLAAGAGTRYGGPKALAETDGRSWLQIAYSLLVVAGISPIVFVLGAEAKRVRAAWSDGPSMPAPGNTLIWTVNENWAAGRTGSIKCGLSALPGRLDGVVIHQVDFPTVQVSTLTAMIERFSAVEAGELSAGQMNAGVVVLPRADGRTGHPILVGRQVMREIETLGPDEPLSNVIKRDASRIIVVQVTDSGIHHNVNTRDE